jgi:peroxiredoxin Q/BCP
LAEYRDAVPEIAAHGAGVVGISVDGPDRSAALRRSLRLPFPLLCDTDRRVVEAWSLYNRAEMGGIAYPAVFVIDRDRTIRYRSLDRTRSRVSTADVISFLRGDAASAGEPRRVPLRPGVAGFALALKNMLRGGIRSPRG